MTENPPEPRYQEAFVDLADVRLHYLHAGSGSPMLLIHGLIGSSANWRNNIGALAQYASVYAIDLVSMGKLQRAKEMDASLAAIANRIVAVMDALNLAEADIAAHSHGGAVGLMLAALHPKRVRRLILFAPANPYSRSSDAMVRIYSTAWGRILASMLPYLPPPIQRIALGEMYGGANRVPDRCLQEIAEGLRSPGTLHHVLCVLRCWCAEMAKLEDERASVGGDNAPISHSEVQNNCLQAPSICRQIRNNVALASIPKESDWNLVGQTISGGFSVLPLPALHFPADI